jgi:hypothetical protein
MFPLGCAGARPHINWKAPAHTELLPHSSNFSVFIVNIIMQIKKTFKVPRRRHVL